MATSESLCTVLYLLSFGCVWMLSISVTSPLSVWLLQSQGKLQKPVWIRNLHFIVLSEKFCLFFSKDLPRTDTIWGKKEWFWLTHRSLMLLCGTEKWYSEALSPQPTGEKCGQQLAQKSTYPKLARPGSISKKVFHFLCNSTAAAG